MRYPILGALIISSIFTYGQIESVELFPAHINDPSFGIVSPSMNGVQTRLCFRKMSSTENAIMISDKTSEGKWSDPYPAFEFGVLDVFQGCSLSADGKHIFFDMNNDIYRLDLADEKTWSKPQLLKSPVSESESMEAWPSVSRDDETLTFLRNIRTGDRWQLTPFISSRAADDQWSAPSKVRISKQKENEEVLAFHYTSEKKLCFFTTGSSKQNWGNYYGTLDSSGELTHLTKIDFKDGYIMWVSPQYTTGLIITPTQKIATIKFSKTLTDRLTSNKKN